MLFDDDLRPFLARLLGWSDEQAVESALRSLELALDHRATLVLHGEGDLVPLALTLRRSPEVTRACSPEMTHCRS